MPVQALLSQQTEPDNLSYGTANDVAYHQKRCNDPIQEDAERNLNPDISVAKHTIKHFKLHFAEYRVHHNQQSNNYTIL